MEDARKQLFLLQAFGSTISGYVYQVNHNQMKFEFQDKSTLYVVYNKIGEYAYQLLFSLQKLDRVRFDSMDKNWNVSTNPHHFHPKNTLTGYKSPMVGNPKTDIPNLIQYIKFGVIKDPKKRF